MTIEMQDGLRVLKLKDHSGVAGSAVDDSLTMLHLWRLLSGGHELRDMTVCERRLS